MPVGTTFTGADAVLKEWYPDGKIEPQVITEAPLLKQIEGTSKNIVTDSVGGRLVVFPVRRGLTQGLGARDRGQANPIPRSQLLDKCSFRIRKLVTRVQIEGEAWRATEGAGKKAFISLIAEETNQGLLGHVKDMNWQLYGDTSNIRGTVSVGSAAGQNITVTMDNVRGFYEDMLVDLYTAGGVAKATELVVTAVDINALTVTLEDTGAVGVAATDTFVRNGNLGNEIMGLSGMVQDSTGNLATFQGLSVASKGYWRAYVAANGGVARNLTTNVMEGAFLASYKQDHTPPDMLLGDYTQQQAYEQLLINDKRFTAVNGRPVLDGGYERLAYNGIPFEADVDVPYGTLFFIKKKYLKLFRQTGYKWQLSPDMKNIWKPVEGQDAYEATAYWEGEFATTRRNAHSKIVDLV